MIRGNQLLEMIGNPGQSTRRKGFGGKMGHSE